MSTYGKITATAPFVSQSFSCPAGDIIDQVTGVSNPTTGAMGIQFKCKGGTKSAYIGTTTGTPFTINGPFSTLVGTGQSGLVSSIGPNATAQTGVKGPLPTSTMRLACPSGQYLGSVGITGNSAEVTGLTTSSCRSPPVPVAPPVPVPTTYSCPSGKILTDMSAFVDPAGVLIGSRFACQGTWLPWNGLSSGGTTKLASNVNGYASFAGTPMAPYLSNATPCPAGSVYTNATVFQGKVTPGGCIPYTPPAVPPPAPPVSYAQSFDCAQGNFIKSWAAYPAAIGIGAQFTCDDGKSSVKYGSLATSAALATNNNDSGFTSISTGYSAGPRLATLGDGTIVSGPGTLAPINCPEGQRVTGVTGKWDSSGVSSVTFRCSPFPVAPGATRGSIPAPTAPVDVAKPAPTPAPVTSTPTPASTPAPAPTPVVPPSIPPVQPPVYTSAVDTIAQIPKYIAPAITTMDLSPLIYIFIALIFLVILGVGIYAYKKTSAAPQR